MELIQVQIPGIYDKQPDVFAEGNLISMSGDKELGYLLTFNAQDILIIFYYFSIHRVVYITASATVPVNGRPAYLEFVNRPRIILAQLTGRSFDRFKRALYLLKKKEAQFYSLSWTFWLRFAQLMRSNKNSQNNIQQLVEMFKQNDEAVIPENSEIE